MHEEDGQTGSKESSPDWRLLLVTALMAGLLIGALAIRYGSFFDYPPELKAARENPNATMDFQEVKEWDRKLLYGNTVLNAALAGAVLAGLMGLAVGSGGVVPRIKGLAVGGVTGLLLGGLGGLLGAFVWQLLFERDMLRNDTGDTTTLAAIANSCAWGAIGIAAAAAVGSHRDRAKAMVAGIAAGILGAWIFMVIVGFALSSVRTGLPIPEQVGDTAWLPARILWAVIPATCIGVLVSRSFSQEAPAGDLSQTP